MFRSLLALLTLTSLAGLSACELPDDAFDGQLVAPGALGLAVQQPGRDGTDLADLKPLPLEDVADARTAEFEVLLLGASNDFDVTVDAVRLVPPVEDGALPLLRGAGVEQPAEVWPGSIARVVVRYDPRDISALTARALVIETSGGVMVLPFVAD